MILIIISPRYSFPFLIKTQSTLSLFQFFLLRSSVFILLLLLRRFLYSSVTGAQNQKKSKVLDIFFSNKAVYQYGRRYPFPMKKLDMWPRFNHSFAFKFFKTFFHLIAIALFIGTTNPHIRILSSCTGLLNNHSCTVIVN